MVLRKLERRTNGGWKPVSVKYIILGAFKGSVIIICQVIFKTKRMPSRYSVDLFTIPLQQKQLYRDSFIEKRKVHFTYNILIFFIVCAVLSLIHIQISNYVFMFFVIQVMSYVTFWINTYLDANKKNRQNSLKMLSFRMLLKFIPAIASNFPVV